MVFSAVSRGVGARGPCQIVLRLGFAIVNASSNLLKQLWFGRYRINLFRCLARTIVSGAAQLNVVRFASVGDRLAGEGAIPFGADRCHRVFVGLRRQFLLCVRHVRPCKPLSVSASKTDRSQTPSRRRPNCQKYNKLFPKAQKWTGIVGQLAEALLPRIQVSFWTTFAASNIEFVTFLIFCILGGRPAGGIGSGQLKGHRCATDVNEKKHKCLLVFPEDFPVRTGAGRPGRGPARGLEIKET